MQYNYCHYCEKRIQHKELHVSICLENFPIFQHDKLYKIPKLHYHINCFKELAGTDFIPKLDKHPLARLDISSNYFQAQCGFCQQTLQILDGPDDLPDLYCVNCDKYIYRSMFDNLYVDSGEET